MLGGGGGGVSKHVRGGRDVWGQLLQDVGGAGEGSGGGGIVGGHEGIDGCFGGFDGLACPAELAAGLGDSVGAGAAGPAEVPEDGFGVGGRAGLGRAGWAVGGAGGGEDWEGFGELVQVHRGLVGGHVGDVGEGAIHGVAPGGLKAGDLAGCRAGGAQREGEEVGHALALLAGEAAGTSGLGAPGAEGEVGDEGFPEGLGDLGGQRFVLGDVPSGGHQDHTPRWTSTRTSTVATA
ncbi:hypothetical protein ES703_26476 [subsurface metagenome]